MNNIFLSQQPDPLLTPRPNFGDPYNQKAMQEYMVMQQMMSAGGGPQKNWISELDSLVKSLSPQVIHALSADQEYQRLSTEFQGAVNAEIMELISPKLNSNQGIIDNIKQQIQKISDIKTTVSNKERENMSELTDYMKNYSHLTFDEYRKLKNGLGGSESTK